MARFTITVPESKTQELLNYLKKLRGVSVETATEQNEESFFIPEWQKEMILERIKNSKPEDFIEWSEAKKMIKRELSA